MAVVFSVAEVVRADFLALGVDAFPEPATLPFALLDEH